MATKKKKILVVDDQEEMRTVLKSILERKEFSVILANDGSEGKKKFSDEKPDLIMSDIRMPVMDGVMFLQSIRSGGNKTPFILMTGFADILETKSAFELGADGFLAKPFRSRELFELISTLLDAAKTDTKNKKSLDGHFVGLEIAKFIIGSKVEFPIYIRFSPYKYVKIAHRGEDLPADRIDQYRAKGVDMLYLLKADFDIYVDMNKKILSAIAQKPTSISTEKATSFVEGATGVIMKDIFAESIDRLHFAEAHDTMATTVSILKSEENIFQVIEGILRDFEELYAHSVCVGMFSVLLAKRLEWTSEKSIRAVSLGGLFHDIGKKMLPKKLLSKKLIELSYEERRELERHPVLGAQLLEQMSNVPDEVLQVVLQHHENCLGTGYPNRLPKIRIHPYAKVVAIANDFMNIVSVEQRRRQDADKDTIYYDSMMKLMTLKGASYESDYFQKFILLFNFGRELLHQIKSDTWGYG